MGRHLLLPPLKAPEKCWELEKDVLSKEALVCGRSPCTDVCDFGARLGGMATIGKSTEDRKWSSKKKKKMLEIRPLEMLARSRKC